MSQLAYVHTPAQAIASRENLRQIEAINALEGLSPSQELRELNERIIAGEVAMADGIEILMAKLCEKYGLSNSV